MSSTQVPLWVPVVVALVGFVGVLGAQLISAWRDDRRWRREQEREETRWSRDRAREIENREYDGRREAYTQVIAAIEGFDWLVYPALTALRRGDELADEQIAELRRAREEMRQSLGPVNLHAPQRFNELLRNAMLPRSRLAMTLANVPPDMALVEELWRSGKTGYRRMRAEMRVDLGLDAEPLPEDDD
ncbi:MAG TPA: hypothetical protein VFV67_11110 [Actinophytocola sp.]|uniref:hypothetical protein n=1 Tax=Actinophytocola sp. TaxID=1872138 RepID=UPI002DBD163E|nr:hypothetical protein [Actinophytocola sp.]HEU5471192.1 hypothetical protein [Actinophytocola sp.]